MFFGTPHDGCDKTMVALGLATARVAIAMHLQAPGSDIAENTQEWVFVLRLAFGALKATAPVIPHCILFGGNR